MVMSAEPLVSVVTPFYNTAPYLEECIQSVLGQSHGNFEYILYDNCSTDGSLEIAERFAKLDSRIRICRAPDFAGQVENYNRAISEVAPGAAYLKIVQADDAIDRECLQRMVAVAESDPAIAIVGSLYLHGSRVCGTGIAWQTNVIDGREICRSQLVRRTFYFGSPTVLLFRAYLLRSRRPFYRDGRYHEDTEAGYEILADAKFGFVHAVLSRLRVDNESIMKTRETFNPMELDRLLVVEQFGALFLNADELAAVRSAAHADYWRCLSRAAISFRGQDYWRYQRGGLATIGWRIQWGQVLGHGISLILGALLLCPGKLFLRITGRIGRRLGIGRAQG